jgi:hypothetical protein
VIVGRKIGREKTMAIDTTDVEVLEEKLAEAEAEASKYRRTLLRAAERLSAIGLIDSNPHALYLFVSGEREL